MTVRDLTQVCRLREPTLVDATLITGRFQRQLESDLDMQPSHTHKHTYTQTYIHTFTHTNIDTFQ